MYQNLENRIAKLEEVAEPKRIETSPLLIIHLSYWESECLPISEPIEEWITYRETFGDKPGRGLQMFVADPKKEWEARRRLQKETKGDNQEKNECPNQSVTR